MKGYAAFLLVLAALAALAALAGAYGESKSLNFQKAIALERAEQLSLDAKRSMLLAAKYGAAAGFLEYLAEIAASGGAMAFDMQEARERIRLGAITSLSLVHAGDVDFEASLWCGEIFGNSELNRIAESSLAQGKPLSCPTCRPLPLCKDFIEVDVLSNSSFANLALGSANLGSTPRIFGITLYSQKFNLSKVAYIPTSEKIFEAPYTVPGAAE